MSFKRGLTFDDVCLVPKYNNIASRTEPDLTTWLTRDTQIKLPIVPANMDTVVSKKLCEVMIQNGVYPLVHRFMSKEEKEFYSLDFGGKCYISSGIKKEDLEETYSLFNLQKEDQFNFRGVVFDIAHGHSNTMIDAIKWFKDRFSGYYEVIAGNVCTERAYHDLIIAGADAIKVGVGPGAACTTRMVTGFGVPQFTAIHECGRVANELRVPLIADGGIRNSRDIVLALAAGASSVMIGKLFALTEESNAEKRGGIQRHGDVSGNLSYTTNTAREAKYRGQASKDFQDDFFGAMKKGTVPEGEAFWAPVSGTTQELIDQLVGGIRSGMTYGGARNIKELQRKAEFLEVSNTYMKESNTRK